MESSSTFRHPWIRRVVNACLVIIDMQNISAIIISDKTYKYSSYDCDTISAVPGIGRARFDGCPSPSGRTRMMMIASNCEFRLIHLNQAINEVSTKGIGYLRVC